MPQLQISSPKPNEPITAGQPLSVAGLARDKGMPEPVEIASVTVAVDNGPLILAELKVIPHQQLTTVSFVAVAQVASVLGPHTIEVTATNEHGLSEKQTVAVFIGASHAAKQPQGILEIRYVNPDQPKDVDALYAQAVAFGQSNPTVIIGGKFLLTMQKAQAKLAADEAKLKQIDDQIAALKAAVVRGVLQNDDQPYPVFGWLEIGYLPQQVHP
jgi:hypothetical protein